MAYTLNDNLKRWAEQYETAEFIQSDPEWKQYKGSKENFYRTFTYADFHDLCARLFDVYSKFENMELALQAQPGGRPLEQLQRLFGDVKGVPDMETKSGCKRLCMFLRWMCRHGSPVDFGLWTICDPRNLIIPLDTHVHKQALRLGLVKRRTPDLQTAIEITDRFAEIFPDDPTKGDFALFGYGVNKGTAAGINDITEATKKLTEATKKGTKAQKKVNEAIAAAVPVADLSIADVLKMPLFFDNVKAQLTSLWNDRETARKKAAKVNERLKAHVIDRMHNAGDWEPGKFIVIFATVLDKVATGYSSNEREFIRAVGMTAFNITMQKLIDDEKKRDNSNGNDKQ